MQSRISDEELVEIFDLCVITDPAERPAPFGHKGGQGVFWPDFQTQQDDTTMIKYFKTIYREIELDYEFTSGKVNPYLGVDSVAIVFLFADVTTQGTFNVTIPYLLFPPVTSANIPEFALYEIFGGVSAIDSAVAVRNQTSTSQVLSFDVLPGSGDIVFIFNIESVPVSDYPEFVRVGSVSNSGASAGMDHVPWA